MAIELQIEVAIVDTEPDLPSHRGIATRASRVVTIVSETTDIGNIAEIMRAVADREVDEVKEQLKDSLEVVARQMRS